MYYIYNFVGWDKEIIDCDGSVTYTAVFELQYHRGDVNHDDKVDEDDAVYLLLLHQLVECVEVADVHLHKLIVRFVLDVL